MRVDPRLASADGGAMFLTIMRLATRDNFLTGKSVVLVARSLDDALPAIFEQVMQYSTFCSKSTVLLLAFSFFGVLSRIMF